MTRARVHLVFGCVLLGCALLAGHEGLRLEQAVRVNDAVAGADRSIDDDALPEALFARALKLAKAGDSRKAIEAYKLLIQGERSDLKHAALYNVGNMYMRDALKDGAQAAIHSLPLIELAKQSYRELLRENPGHWDARYNLERALWLAPEFAEETAEEEAPEIWNRRVIRATQGFKIELP